MNISNFEKYYKGCNLLSRKASIDFEAYMFNEMKMNKKSYLSFPILVGIKITNGCNFYCKHCFSDRNNPKYLSVDNSKEIVKKVFGKNKPYKIYITGGEPLVNPDFIEIVKIFKKNCSILSIHTNASLITDSMAKKLKEVLDENDYIQVSLDGYNRETFNLTRNTDKYIEVINGIELLVRHGINVSINTVVTNLNIEYIDRVYDLATKINVTSISFSPLIECKQNVELYAPNEDIVLDKFNLILEKHYSNKNNKVQIIQDPIAVPWNNPVLKEYVKESPLVCPAGKTAIEINYEGNVYPCPYMHYEKFNMGNVYKDDFEVIWNSDKWSLLREENWTTNNKCKKCDCYSKCKGGCMASAYLNNVDYDPRCKQM